jgi:hypothetical protein
MLDWFNDHRTLLMGMTVGSAALCVVTLVLAGVVAVRMPSDALRSDHEQGGQRHSGMHLAGRIARNILGWALIIAGLAMLVLPGPGVVVLVIGVVLADFPGKRRALRWIISRGKVLKSLNWFRRKFGRPPLRKPTRDPHPDAAKVQHA